MLEKLLVMLGEAAAMNEDFVAVVKYIKNENAFVIVDNINAEKFKVTIAKER